MKEAAHMRLAVIGAPAANHWIHLLDHLAQFHRSVAAGERRIWSLKRFTLFSRGTAYRFERFARLRRFWTPPAETLSPV